MVYLNSRPDQMLPSNYCSTESQNRVAFTLIELLVVMMILSILASIVLFALASVTESAKDMKTRATISKLNAIVMAKWESYRTRRVPVNAQIEPYTDTNGNGQHDSGEPYVDLNGNGRYDGLREVQLLRLNALRELMRAEMPDGFVDISDTNNPNPKFLSAWPSVRASYNNALQAIRSDQKFSSVSKHEESAACLYFFVTKGSGDPDVLEQFAPNEIETGDDGLKYFVDGWGKPIRFLRWAPAFRSPRSPLQKGPGNGEHDPFDPANLGASLSPAQDTFPLTPLIYSAGPDKKYDIGEQPTNGANYTSIDNSPFHASVKDLIGNYQDLETPPDGVDNSIDNITNHDLSGS
jgi:prepilin-type N-terminal cleavage/methylation domain-containing protein